MLGELLLSLNLTDDQKAKIRKIAGDMRKQNHSVTDPQVRRENYKKMNDQIRAILTPPQQKMFDEKLAEMRAKYKQQQQGGSH
jgi:Spy/CpxP family protein refolding chaperone